MTSTQVAAGIALLRKVLPDLSASTVEQTVTNYVARLPAPIDTSEEWKNRYSKSSGSPSQDHKPH